jgi:hypothetical protein
MRTPILRACLAFALFAMAFPAAAQEHDDLERICREIWKQDMGKQILLISFPRVQIELRLEDRQIEEIRRLAEKVKEQAQVDESFYDEMEGDWKKADRGGAEAKARVVQRSRKVLETIKKSDGAYRVGIKKILKPEQSKRLNQIRFQARGTSALEDRSVQAALKLTDDQKRGVRLLESYYAGEREKVRSKSKESLDKDKAFLNDMKRFSEMDDMELKDCLRLLNDDQLKIWRELTGEPFGDPSDPYGP